MAIDQGERAEEFVPGDGFVVGVGNGEVGAGDEAGAKRQDKQQAGEKEGFSRGTVRDTDRVGMPCGVCAPVWRCGCGGRGAIWK